MIRYLIPALAIILASCGSTAPAISSTEESANEMSNSIIDFEKASWRLTSLKNEEETFIVKHELITLNIDLETGDYSGKAGCNSYFGQTEKIDQDKLIFSPGGMTEMMCEDDLMRWESRYLMSLFEQEFTVSIQKNMVLLVDKENGTVLSFTPILAEE